LESQKKEKIKTKNENIDFLLKILACTYRFVNEMNCFYEEE
jgi:hypothetical protein